MTDIAIRVENLSKLYTIGRAQQQHDTLRDSIADCRLKIQDSLRPRHLQSSISNLQSPEDLWALRDVSFEVKQGEVVGVPSTELRAGIGRNGAGKSTLPSAKLRTRLKILSRITEPTSGRAETCPELSRRMGTGFHPDPSALLRARLSGRENIYLNGATPSTGSGQAWACGAPRPVLSSVEASQPGSTRPVLSESKHRGVAETCAE